MSLLLFIHVSIIIYTCLHYYLYDVSIIIYIMSLILFISCLLLFIVYYYLYIYMSQFSLVSSTIVYMSQFSLVSSTIVPRIVRIAANNAQVHDQRDILFPYNLLNRLIAWAVAKLSIATGHAMQIYNCLNCPRQSSAWVNRLDLLRSLIVWKRGL